MRRRYSLRSAVTLPNASMIEHEHLVVALNGPSKQLLALWRRSGFPPSFRDGRSVFMLIDTVAAWLRDRNVAVKRD